jgi:SAM-dependent methyltransferase
MGNTLQTNREIYDFFWKYAHFRSPATNAWWPVSRELARTAGDRLEIGPGPYPKFPLKGTHVVELSSWALPPLERRGAIIHRCLLSEAGFADRSFDLAGLFEVLEHIEDDVTLLRELSRLLRPSARLILSVPLWRSNWILWDQFCGHVRRYDPGELREKLEEAGFTIESFAVRGVMRGSFQRVTSPMAVWVMRHLPRLTFWVFERFLLPFDALIPLFWKPGSHWDERRMRGVDCTVVCRRN